MMLSVLVIALLSLGAPQNPKAPAPPETPGAAPITLPASPDATASPTDPSTPLDPDSLGISLDRIQRGVSRPQGIKLTESRQVFRMEVFGNNPTIIDILGPDYLKGPVPYSGMTHQEFLNMVTPKDVQGYAAFSNRQGMIVAATSIALQWALQKALDKYKDARNERAKAAASREVQEALDALRKARRDAGLPDK